MSFKRKLKRRQMVVRGCANERTGQPRKAGTCSEAACSGCWFWSAMRQSRVLLARAGERLRGILDAPKKAANDNAVQRNVPRLASGGFKELVVHLHDQGSHVDPEVLAILKAYVASFNEPANDVVHEDYMPPPPPQGTPSVPPQVELDRPAFRAEARLIDAGVSIRVYDRDRVPADKRPTPMRPPPILQPKLRK